ncbi:P-loop containing nucleoside triphosphate hydrolase protein [Chaetomium sp. MPI-SDFR-AT-0129]|nr:P-loop containing nucleoside triphosphate hydrolase protein [Chaetomium sp. MPI-SDFR-AT-0129]
MSDLSRVLPHFPIGQFARLIPALEKHAISTSELLTLEAADIGKRTQLPLLDVKRLCSAVLTALHADLGVQNLDAAARAPAQSAGPEPEPGAEAGPNDRKPPGHPPKGKLPTTTLRNTAASLAAQWQTISTLDPELDRALGGGIPAGYITEVTGESGSGKTQFLLSLLLSVQLPPPHGLGRPALYVSTEAALSTRRLDQMLSANPVYQRLPPKKRPSLDNIISTVTPDLESQDHILTYQVPVEVERRGIGLVVLDSVAANYRAEFERSAGQGQQGLNMGARTGELVRLGMQLRDLAQRYNLAVVVANQVADRFGGGGTAKFRTPVSFLHQPQHPPSSGPPPRLTQESPLATRSRPLPSLPLPTDPPPSSVPLPSSYPAPLHEEPPPPPEYLPTSTNPTYSSHPGKNNNNDPETENDPALLLDHQQRWFTGWGDDPYFNQLKTPSLGLVWTTQIAIRVALFRRPVSTWRMMQNTTAPGGGGGTGGGGWSTAGWERLMKVVFAAHVGETGPGLEGAVGFEVWMGGLRGKGIDEKGGEGGKEEVEDRKEGMEKGDDGVKEEE